MTAFNADNAAFGYVPDQYIDASGLRTWGVRNAECWFRIFGDSLTVEYRAAGTQPLWISVDGGAFTRIAASQFPGASASVTNTSLNLLPGSPTDAWHDIRLRVDRGYGDTGFVWQISGGIIVTSSGGTAQVAAHSDFGAMEALRGAHGLAYWEDSFSNTNNSLASGYGGADPIFCDAQPNGANSNGRGSTCRFYVDGDTTKVYPIIEYDSNDRSDLDCWVDGKMVQKLSSADADSQWLGTTFSAFDIPGSGVREVIIGNAASLYGFVIDGAFPEQVVSSRGKPLVCITGDSASAGDSHTEDGHVITQPRQLYAFRGDFRFKNVAVSGLAIATAISSNYVDNDIASPNHDDPDIVICNLGINDGAAFNTSPAATEANYVSYFQDILATLPSATLYVIPPIDSQNPTYASDIRTGLSNAVTTVDDARCIFIDSASWDVSTSSQQGAHPDTLGYGQATGFGVVEVLANPSSGQSVTIDGIEFAFGSGGDVTVTIGSDLTESVGNLITALEANSISVLIDNNHTLLSGADPGVVITGVSSMSDSGSGNVNAYLESAGWKDAFVTMLGELPVVSPVTGRTGTASPASQSVSRSVSRVVSSTEDE